MKFGVQFFPDVKPDQKSGAQYFNEALVLAEEGERLGFTHIASSSIIFTITAVTARTRCCFSPPPRSARAMSAW